MSYGIFLDQKGVGDFASTSGMAEFGRWVDSLPIAGYEELIRLREYGWCQSLPALESQLKVALASTPLDKNTRSTAQGLADVLAERGDASVVVISDGCGGLEVD